MSFLRVVVAVLMLFPVASFAAEPGSARLSLITGDVQIYTNDTQDWVAASINMPLLEGDRIWVPEGGRAEVHVQGGVYIRLGAATAFDILALQEESFQFYLNGGHVYINNRKGGIDYIQVDTPLSSVGCYDNSLVMIDVAQSGATDVSALKGYATAETRSGKTRIEAGNTLYIESDMSAELSPLAPPDEWENWNLQRDRKLAAGSRSLRYIPEELDDYAEELDDNGQWVYVTDYGYCWRPITVAVDWSPYRNGRWSWVGGDYVWISYDPWGWGPHHYGRWNFVVNFGWCWVPPRAGAVYWGPGFVGWVSTPTYVAWVPLAPGEIFYGRRYYGPGSVNITNVTINQTVVQNFRNVNVRNAVTVVNTNTFITGRKEPVRFKGNPFREANVKTGPPVIKPTRETSRPVIRDIPTARKPPERVRNVTVNQIKQERPLVREEKGSAFKMQRPGTEMPVKTRGEPQRVIREQHPAIPEAKPRKKSPFAPRGEQQPAAKQPEVIRGRPTAPAVKQAPEQPQPARQPERIRGRPIPPSEKPVPERQLPAKQPEVIRGRPTAPAVKQAPEQPPSARQPEIIRGRPTPPAAKQAPEQQPPAKQPEIIRERPTPPTEKTAPSPQQPQTVVPGRSSPQTRGAPPAKAPREPRWQEPIPAGMPKPRTSPKSRPQKPMPATEAPTQPSPQQPVPRPEAPPRGKEERGQEEKP